MEKLDEEENKLLKTMNLVYVPGKGSKLVPILFPPFIIPTIDKLAANGKTYVFENSCQGFIRGNDALRSISRAAGLSTSCVTSTKFRKLAATTLQVRNIAS